MAYTKAELKRDLAAMGLTGNETILIHSSMRSIGAVEGGADTVLDALMEFFAEGLLLLPTHTWRFINEENRVFDVRRSPCCVGILPELFRQRPGVVRSLHPTHSMAAYGKGAAAYIEGELNANTPCTPGGCYDRLRAAHGKVLLLGVTHARNTFIHSVEEVLNVPNRLTDKPMQMTVVDEAGAQHTVYMRRHYNAQQPHISEDFVKLEQAYLDCGAARNTKFGDAKCILCDAEGLFRVTRHVLAPNPEALSPKRSSRRSAGRVFAPAKPAIEPARLLLRWTIGNGLRFGHDSRNCIKIRGTEMPAGISVPLFHVSRSGCGTPGGCSA